MLFNNNVYEVLFLYRQVLRLKYADSKLENNTFRTKFQIFTKKLTMNNIPTFSDS